MNAGGRESMTKARDLLNEVVSARPNDARSLYQLSQAQRRLGDLDAAESTARKLIAQNGRSPMGYYALAMTLEERRQYQAVIEALAPATADLRTHPGTNPAADLGLLLPHLGFAYQELGEYDESRRDLRRSAQAGSGRHDDHRVSGAGQPLGQEVRGGDRRRAQGPRRQRRRSPSRAHRSAGAASERQARRSRERPAGLREEAGQPGVVRRAGADVRRRKARRRSGEAAAGGARRSFLTTPPSASSSAPCSTSRRSSPTPKPCSGRC